MSGSVNKLKRKLVDMDAKNKSVAPAKKRLSPGMQPLNQIRQIITNSNPIKKKEPRKADFGGFTSSVVNNNVTSIVNNNVDDIHSIDLTKENTSHGGFEGYFNPDEIRKTIQVKEGTIGSFNGGFYNAPVEEIPLPSVPPSYYKSISIDESPTVKAKTAYENFTVALTTVQYNNHSSSIFGLNAQSKDISPSCEVTNTLGNSRKIKCVTPDDWEVEIIDSDENPDNYSWTAEEKYSTLEDNSNQNIFENSRKATIVTNQPRSIGISQEKWIPRMINNNDKLDNCRKESAVQVYADDRGNLEEGEIFEKKTDPIKDLLNKSTPVIETQLYINQSFRSSEPKYFTNANDDAAVEINNSGRQKIRQNYGSGKTYQNQFKDTPTRLSHFKKPSEEAKIQMSNWRSLTPKYNEPTSSSNCNNTDRSSNISSVGSDDEQSIFKINLTPTLERKRYSNWRTEQHSPYNQCTPHYSEVPLPQCMGFQFIGDSQFVRLSTNILRQKGQNLRDRRIGFCVSGQTIEDLHSRISKKEWPLSDKLVLMIGTNNLNRENTAESMISKMKELVNSLTNLQKLFILTIPPILAHQDNPAHWQTLYAFNHFIMSEYENDPIVSVINVAPLYIVVDGSKCQKDFFEEYYGNTERRDDLHLNRLGLQILYEYVRSKIYDYNKQCNKERYSSSSSLN